MKGLAIIGAGGLAREASLLVEDINSDPPDGRRWNLLGFIDEDRSSWGRDLRGYPVLGGAAALAALPPDTEVVCAVADPRIKRRLVRLAEDVGLGFATLVAAGAAPIGEVTIGRGVMINKGCLLTTNIRLDDHVILNPGCAVGHDAEVGPFTTLMWRVNISGAAVIGEGCSLGTATTVLQGLQLGQGCITGAGAVVTRDLPPDCTAVGVPARVVKLHESPWSWAAQDADQEGGRRPQP
jgi:sugar O-acyltransferase (sialic acid O-acetyltransferase NeuD family)